MTDTVTVIHDDRPLVIVSERGVQGDTIEHVVWGMGDQLVVTQGPARFYVEDEWEIISVRAAVGTAPTGAAVIVDVNRNGTSIFTTQSKRPTIAAGTFTDLAETPDVTTLTAGDYLSIDIDQVGSTVKGSDLTVTIQLRRA